MDWVMVLSLIVVVALAAAATRGWAAGRRFVVIPPSRHAKQDQPHRQAIHHFASGVLPPWR
jgi:hypothetical protein